MEEKPQDYSPPPWKGLTILPWELSSLHPIDYVPLTVIAVSSWVCPIMSNFLSFAKPSHINLSLFTWWFVGRIRLIGASTKKQQSSSETNWIPHWWTNLNLGTRGKILTKRYLKASSNKKKTIVTTLPFSMIIMNDSSECLKNWKSMKNPSVMKNSKHTSLKSLTPSWRTRKMAISMVWPFLLTKVLQWYFLNLLRMSE